MECRKFTFLNYKQKILYWYKISNVAKVYLCNYISIAGSFGYPWRRLEGVLSGWGQPWNPYRWPGRFCDCSIPIPPKSKTWRGHHHKTRPFRVPKNVQKQKIFKLQWRSNASQRGTWKDIFKNQEWGREATGVVQQIHETSKKNYLILIKIYIYTVSQH